MGNKSSTSHSSTFSRGQGVTSDIRDALATIPGSQPKNKTGRKVTAQKVKTAGATGVLALQEHGLKEIPEDIFQLINLRTLNLASNALKIIPGALCSLTKLKTLRVDNNKLETLPDLSALLALTDLSARGNHLQGANALGPLPPSLIKLGLQGNQLGGFPASLPSRKQNSSSLNTTNSLLVVTTLQVLDLSENGIVFVPALSPCLPLLVELSLDSNSIGSLGGDIAGLRKLKKLSLRRNRIGSKN
ncbi:unnamed protein product, partial [Choristocarpus tenellus]